MISHIVIDFIEILERWNDMPFGWKTMIYMTNESDCMHDNIA